MDEFNDQTQAEFLKDLDIDQKVTDDAAETETAEPEGETKETAEATEQQLKNRRERRLAEKLQTEREANIALNERVKVLSEVGRFREESGGDSLKEVEAIFGVDTPEKLAATNILKKALSGMGESAIEKAVERIEAKRAQEAEESRKQEKALDAILESVEEDHGIDMSVDSERKGFLKLLEKVSHKDDDGNITEWADADSVAELYLSRRDRSNVRAKELSSRSMTRGGAAQPSKLESDATERFLRENGII